MGTIKNKALQADRYKKKGAIGKITSGNRWYVRLVEPGKQILTPEGFANSSLLRKIKKQRR